MKTHARSVRRRALPLLPAALLLTLMTSMLFVPGLVQGDEGELDRVIMREDRISIFGDEVYIPADAELRGSILCIGSKAVIEGDVHGDVVIIFGSVELRGEVDGSVIGVISDMDLEGARVDEMLLNALGKLDKRDSSASQVFNFGLGSWFPGWETLVYWTRSLRLLFVFVLLLLVTVSAPERVRIIADHAPVRYVSAFFVGLLAYLAYAAVMVLLLATVLGFAAAWVLWVIFKWLSVAGIFLAVGRSLGRALGREVSVLGGVLLSFAVYAVLLLAMAPLGFPGLLASWTFSFFFWLMVQVPAVGLLVLTRVGTRSTGVAAAPPAAAPTAPAVTVEPVAPAPPQAASPAAAEPPPFDPPPPRDE